MGADSGTGKYWDSLPESGEDGMARSVNLDALIPREDFATQSDGDFEKIERIGTRDLEQKTFLLNALRKPDFQRETASWEPEAVLELVRAFLEGDLIPAVILWQSGPNVFVIDGAHRLSALIAWVNNDYGDGVFSKKLYSAGIPAEQMKVANKTRDLLNAKLGSYADHKEAVEHPQQATPLVKSHMDRLAFRAVMVQWVPGDDVKKAERSFFTINQAGTPINEVETIILESRGSGNALAARAIVKGGEGHRYWRNFPQVARTNIEAAAREIHSILYNPGLELPIKTLDIPLAGNA